MKGDLEMQRGLGRLMVMACGVLALAHPSFGFKTETHEYITEQAIKLIEKRGWELYSLGYPQAGDHFLRCSTWWMEHLPELKKAVVDVDKHPFSFEPHSPPTRHGCILGAEYGSESGWLGDMPSTQLAFHYYMTSYLYSPTIDDAVKYVGGTIHLIQDGAVYFHGQGAWWGQHGGIGPHGDFEDYCKDNPQLLDNNAPFLYQFSWFELDRMPGISPEYYILDLVDKHKGDGTYIGGNVPNYKQNYPQFAQKSLTDAYQLTATYLLYWHHNEPRTGEFKYH
jgi:hypothetical protein